MNQTPVKELSRRSDLGNRRSVSHLKKNQSVPKKNLDDEFRKLTVEIPSEIQTENLSPGSVVSESSCNTVAHNSENAVDPSLFSLIEPFTLVDLTPSSTITEISPDHYLSNSRLDSTEIDVAVRFLKRILRQTSESTHLDTLSKKILESVITTVVNELTNSDSGKRVDDCLIKLIRVKTILLACFFIWMLALIVFVFICSASQRAYVGPLPT